MVPDNIYTLTFSIINMIHSLVLSQAPSVIDFRLTAVN